MLVDQPEKVQVFGFVVIFPMTFASSAFVPTGTMPGWMQAWVKVNPVTLLTDAMRGLLVDGAVLRPALGAAVGLLALLVSAAGLHRWYHVDHAMRRRRPLPRSACAGWRSAGPASCVRPWSWS